MTHEIKLGTTTHKVTKVEVRRPPVDVMKSYGVTVTLSNGATFDLTDSEYAEWPVKIGDEVRETWEKV